MVEDAAAVHHATRRDHNARTVVAVDRLRLLGRLCHPHEGAGERLGHVLRQIFDCALLWLCVTTRTNINLFDVGMTGKQSRILMVILVQLCRKHV